MRFSPIPTVAQPMTATATTDCARRLLTRLRGIRIGDLFNAFFGAAGARQGPAQGGDVAVRVDIDLLQAANGARVEVSYEAVDRCEHCKGNGAEPGTRSKPASAVEVPVSFRP